MTALAKGTSGAGTPQKSSPLPVLERYLPISSSIVDRAIFAAIYDAMQHKGWSLTRNGDPSYVYNEGNNGVIVYLKAPAPDANPLPLDAAFELDELTCDVFCSLMAHWRGARDHDGCVQNSSATMFCERDRKPKTRQANAKRYKSGYRREDLEEINRRVSQLRNIFLRVQRSDVYSEGRKTQEPVVSDGRLLSIFKQHAKPTLEGNEGYHQTWTYRMYTQLDDVVERHRFAYLSRKVLAYDTIRRLPEKRLGRYVAHHFRMNNGLFIQRKISTLIAGCNIKYDQQRPQRLRSRIECALHRLVKDGVIGGWCYRIDRGAGDRHLTQVVSISGYSWFTRWNDYTLVILPPTDLPQINRSHHGRTSRPSRTA